MKSISKLVAGVTLCGAAFVWTGIATTSRAADHADAPNVDNDAGADIADVYFFRDPADNSKVCLLGTVHGFIVPGQAPSLAAFDPNVQYRFDFENTGDAKADASITVTFSERGATTATPQMATVRLPNKQTFTAPTTPPTNAGTANPQTVTPNAGGTGVDFFAGETDDPFFFDLTAFQRFVASAAAGAANPALLERGRDTFAGYNVLAICMRFPADLIRGKDTTNTKVGVEFITSRKSQSAGKNGTIKASGKFRQIDRMGNPGVTTGFIPFPDKSAYNGSTPLDDSKGKFAKDITAVLDLLGTTDPNRTALANVVLTNGDFLRLDLTVPNTGTGGGDNIPAQFPNGRRPKDDVIDVLLTLLTNGDPTVRPFPVGDHVDANDVPFQDQFPFLALPQQPRENTAGGPTVDDNTRN